MQEYCKFKIKYFRRFLVLKHLNPDHDTFNDVLNHLNHLKPKEFSTAFTSWVTELNKHNEKVIALDGTDMRRTLDNVSGMSATHLDSAWSVDNNFCLGRIKVADKSNKISPTPILLELLDIKYSKITTEAMGSHYKIGDQCEFLTTQSSI